MYNKYYAQFVSHTDQRHHQQCMAWLAGYIVRRTLACKNKNPYSASVNHMKCCRLSSAASYVYEI